VRVLLTGAAGFIGTRVAAALAGAGHEVVGLDAMLTAAHGPDAELPPDIRRVDVRDAAALAPLLEGIDHGLTLIMIAIALGQAWRTNRRVEPKLTGPFRVRTASAI